MGALFGVCFKTTFGICFPKCRKRCCKKKAAPIKMHELNFMSTISEGFAYNNPQIIDSVFDKAVAAGCINQIFEAKDEDGDLPIHKASFYGNPTSTQWIFDKWEDHG